MQNIELGDVFSIETKKGFGFLQCVEIPNDKKNEIELVKVFYQLNSKIINIEDVVETKFFYIRFPLVSALRKKIVAKIGNVGLPKSFNSPSFFRTANIFGSGWQIVNAKTLHRETVNELSSEQKKLSPWGMMNDE